jgi:superfamily II DNA/RNA helicase
MSGQPLTRDEVCDKFLETVPYDLFPVQEEALMEWFSCEGGVLVCAPTGTGKTLIAEAAVYEALQQNQTIYYTTPLIALTEQKFRELREKAIAWGFSADDVGFITGNRRENPNARVRVVVAEILLNHLLGREDNVDFANVSAVVMDEFHSFNDRERGVVWELSLVMLPPTTRVMLLSATVGNPVEFADWLKKQHRRQVQVVTSNERRVPLEYVWTGDELLTELLPEMVSSDDSQNRTPALVFCFNRDECWDLAEKLKGLKLVPESRRKELEQRLAEYDDDLKEGVGPKLRQMLLRGVGVHHAGVLPNHKRVVEDLFIAKLVPFVACTETLAAGVNLPARSTVLKTLLKGKPGERKLIPASAAHQMFGRAGRPQFDTQGFVYAVAHDDDVKIAKWKKKYDQIDPKSKDPGILRAKKDLERKKPSRRSTEQYWTEGQFRTLIEAGPAKLSSRSMIPYSVLIYLLTKTHSLAHIKTFLNKRFAPLSQKEKFASQLDHMLENLAALGYLTRAEDEDHVTLDESINRLTNYRSVDPLYGEFLVERLNYADENEKLLALESVLELPWQIVKRARIPRDREQGPLESEILRPQLIAMGVQVDWPAPDEEEEFDPWATEEDLYNRPPEFPEMLKLVFDSLMPAPEPIPVQPKYIAASAILYNGEFFKMVKGHDLVKQEGLVLRHLLRLVILAQEFYFRCEDPAYQWIAEQATKTCQRVDAEYTDHFLEDAAAQRGL